MKKSTLLIAMTFVWSLSFAQIDKNWRIENYTNPDDIVIITEAEIGDEMKNIGTVFAKARGVTTIAAINNINNRALRKLKTEVSMRGGSHLIITQESQENTIFSKTSAYSGIIFKSQPLDVDKVKALLESNNFAYKFERTYNRNKFEHRDNVINQPLQKQQWNQPYMKNGKIILEIMEYLSNKNKLSHYEVIAYSDSQILIFREDIPGKTMKMINLEAVK